LNATKTQGHFPTTSISHLTYTIVGNIWIIYAAATNQVSLLALTCNWK